MFTGIVSQIGTITSADERGDLRITVSGDFSSLKVGDSVAVSGACLTIVEVSSNSASFDLSAETVRRTAPAMWMQGRRVNLERSLKMGDSLDGHMVTGHIDGIARVFDITPSGDSRILGFEVPLTLAPFIAEKGSVCLDGISLTVNRVEGARFWVNIIPHTLAATTLGERQLKDAVNLEIDLIARYVHRLTQK